MAELSQFGVGCITNIVTALSVHGVKKEIALFKMLDDLSKSPCCLSAKFSKQIGTIPFGIINMFLGS